MTTMTTDRKILIGLGIFLLVLLSAGASAYYTKYSMENDKPKAEKVVKRTSSKNIAWDQPRAAVQPQQPVRQVNCDDSNIVGTVAGGAAGGIIGSQVGKGNGKTAATIGGTLGGAYLGNQYMPTRNVTCR